MKLGPDDVFICNFFFVFIFFLWLILCMPGTTSNFPEFVADSRTATGNINQEFQLCSVGRQAPTRKQFSFTRAKRGYCVPSRFQVQFHKANKQKILLSKS